MCSAFKKLAVVGVVVAGAFLLLNNTWAGSHFRLWWKQAKERVRGSVSPEREIERIRMEVANLKSQDGVLIDKVARMAVEAEKLEAAVAGHRKELVKSEASLKAMHAALKGKDELVSLHGERFPRAEVEKELRADFEAFEKEEEHLKSREAHLAELKRGLALNRAKLRDLRLQRERMLTEVQRLDTALAEERRARALQDSVIDDAAGRKVMADIERLKDEVAVMRKGREERGALEGSAIKEAERRKERQEKLDARMKQRLGGE
jgi:hypothetical protein